MHTRKKTYLLPQELIDQMRRTFGSKTETDAIIQAMKEISFRSQVIQWHEKNKGRFKIRKVYG